MSSVAFLAQPIRWLQAIHAYRGTLTGSPNFGYDPCTRRVGDEELRGLDLSTLRFAFCGAEAAQPETLERFGRRFATCGFRPEALAPAYGLVEAAVDVALPPVGRGVWVDCVDGELQRTAGRAMPTSVGHSHVLRVASWGRPLPGYQVRIIDASGSELPERCEGALQFKGPSATAGYYRNPAATAGLRHGEWLDTGDLAYLAEGELYITGRVKDLIIRRGRHIYPEELENAIGEHPHGIARRPVSAASNAGERRDWLPGACESRGGCLQRGSSSAEHRP
ncbi:MAG TPA: AMP-binding protein [Steroidobacteraceae bacterium]|nr:AMP-binding protein [Steroidobacteraceae bacterium]